MRKMFRWFVNNVGLMLLALLFGFGAWALSSWQDDPIIEDNLSVKVVKLGENQLDSATWTGTLPVSVTVRVRAQRSTFNQLNSRGLSMNVDLSKMGIGTHIVPLTPTLPTAPVVILSSQPVTALVTIQQLVQVKMPVRISVVGTPALGFRGGLPTSIPLQVTITTTADVISRVVSADAVVSVDGARSSVESEVPAYARDSNGDIVTEAHVSPSSVSVRVPMEQLSNYRDMAVLVKRSGQPAEGYAVTDVSVDPVIVTIYGPVDAVQATKGYIETLEVNINNAKSDLDEQVGLDVPAGVSLVSEKQTSVHVHIGVQPLRGTRTVKRSPVLIGLNNVYSSTVSPDTVDILLNGPLPSLNTLTDSDVIVELDVSGLVTGVHQLTPVVRVPEGITAQSVLPATVQVELVPLGSERPKVSP
jgi:YbbR domain-containing protein